EGGNEEKPAHKVKISKPFYMGKYHVTVAQFRAFVDATKHVTEAEKAGNKGYTWDNGWKELGGVNWMKPNFPQEDNHPVCLVTWNDAKEFCKWVAKKTGRNACLPTEALWEYACRAGTTTKFNTGDKDSDLEQAGWFSKNSGTRTHPVGQRKPDAWGLYDMHGNVWEWVQDYFNDNYYAESPPVDPKGPTSGGNRVLRGGSWDAGPDHCRAAHRDRGDPGCRATKLGFRLALDVSEGGVPITVQPQTTNQKPETGVTDAWIKMVQAQPAEKQVEEVVKKLKELNPGYDGKVEPKINDANVAGLSLTPGPLRDISPLRALAKLEELGFGDWAVSKPLADLRPLNGLMLRALDIRGTKVHDLVPLKEMPLRFLYMTQTPVSDLSPLANMPLTELSVDVTSVTDLSPIRKLRLTALFMAHTKISDLEPVRGMPLSVLTCSDTKVMTLAPLIASPLKRLHCDFKPDRDAAILRSIKTLEIINYLPVAEFWKKYPEAGTAKPDAGAERAWKPIFDGKTLECLDEGGKEAWRVENGVLTNTPGKASCGTKAQFGDGDVRVCFEVIGNAWVEMKMYRPGPPAESTYMVAPVPKGARELIFSRRGNQVSASVDGQATEVKTFGPPTNQGGLVFFVDKGALRVKSIEYRELAPERLEVGQKDKDGWTCIFNGRDLTGWEVNGKPKVEDAAIVLPEGSETVRRTDKADFELRGSVKAVSGRLFCGVLAFRLGRDPLPRLSFCTDGDVHFWEAGATPLAKSGPGRVPVGVWRSFALRVVGTSVSVEVESKPAVKATVARQDATGLALQAWAGDGRAIAFKDLWLRELGPDGKPLGAAPKP
ncbi:MAG: SUMF1/EgtB/PvdO family nonheme iron enzyme, partial [Planctomycetota bacterium]|nr:SUMF1/EgtB/PvdO family nonheme iron enzyme [Planctomycetota bacterium]